MKEALSVTGLMAGTPIKGEFGARVYIAGAHPEVADIPTPEGLIRIGYALVDQDPMKRTQTTWMFHGPEGLKILRDFMKDQNLSPEVRSVMNSVIAQPNIVHTTPFK